MFGSWKGGGGTCMSNFDGDLSNQRIDQYRIALTFKKKPKLWVFTKSKSWNDRNSIQLSRYVFSYNV